MGVLGDAENQIHGPTRSGAIDRPCTGGKRFESLPPADSLQTGMCIHEQTMNFNSSAFASGATTPEPTNLTLFKTFQFLKRERPHLKADVAKRPPYPSGLEKQWRPTLGVASGRGVIELF